MSLKLAIALLCAAVLGVAQSSSSTTTTTQSPPVQISAEQAAPPQVPPVAVPSATDKPAEGKPAENKRAVKAKGGANKTDPKAPKPITSVEEARTTYVIGPLDVLQIRVWNNPNLTNIYDVRSDGMISIPLVGEVKVDGLTVEQLKKELGKRISDAGQKEPEVDIQVPRVNSKRYYVTGGVRKQGEFSLPQPITVLDALINAGGFTEFSNPKKVYVLRGPYKYYFNYKEVINGKNLEQNIVVMPNDRIVVPD